MVFEAVRVEPETGDDLLVGWSVRSGGRYVLGVALVVVVIALAFAGVIAIPGISDPTIADVPGEGERLGALNLTAVEARFHAGLNNERRSVGAAPLDRDERLGDIARYHVHDMVKNDYYGYVSPAGRDVADRYRAFNYRCDGPVGAFVFRFPAEIAATVEESTESELVDALLGRILDDQRVRNYLFGTWNAAGVDVHVDADGSVFLGVYLC
jgi:uncharacterized protein YkwD